MNKKVLILSSLIILLLAVNIFLIVKKDSKTVRSYYIKNWTTVKQQNLRETLPVEGVSIPVEKQLVYFDEKSTTFGNFLVQKGETVEPGTSLMEYTGTGNEQAKEKLETDKAQLEKEILILENQINELYNLQYSLVAPKKEEDASNYEWMRVTLQQDILEKEKQKEIMDSEYEKYEQLMLLADESELTLTKDSYLSGIVKEVKEDLSNPIMTIISNEQKVEGLLTEQELPKVKEGMKVYSLESDITGTIETVSRIPKEEPDVEKESRYAFTVQLEESKDSFPIGAHLPLKIVTKEIQDAITVPVESISKERIYVLRNGQMERRKIKKGFQLDRVQEIKNGVEPKETIALNQPINIKHESSFFTTLKIHQWEKKTFKKQSKRQIVKTIAKGFLSNP